MLQPVVKNFGAAGAVLMTFLSGIIILILGLLQLGFLIDFFSYPIIAGFICASSFNIASSQIKNIFGIPGKTDTFIDSWTSIFENISSAQQWDSVLGLLSIVLIVCLKVSFKQYWSKLLNIFDLISLQQIFAIIYVFIYY